MKDSEIQHLLQRLESAEEALKEAMETIHGEFCTSSYHHGECRALNKHFEKYGEKAI